MNKRVYHDHDSPTQMRECLSCKRGSCPGWCPKMSRELKKQEGVYIVDGMAFTNYDQLAKTFHTCHKTLQKLMEEYGNAQAAIDAIRKGRVTYTFDGRIYTNLKDISRDADVPYTSLRRHVVQGDTPDEAVDKIRYHKGVERKHEWIY